MGCIDIYALKKTSKAQLDFIMPIKSTTTTEEGKKKREKVEENL